MTSKYQIYLFSFLLIFISLATMAYKVKVLDFPLFSGEEKSVWNVEAKVQFRGNGDNAFISLALPDEQEGMFVYNENASSANYGYSTAASEGYLRGEWAKRKVKGTQTLYYSIDVISDKDYRPEKIREYKNTHPIQASSLILQAASAVMKDAYDHSADDISMAARLIGEFNKKEPSQAIEMLKRKFIHSKKNLRDVLAALLEDKNVNLRRIGALELIDGQKNVFLKPMLEVYANNKWQLFDIKKGKIDKSDKLFIW